MLQMMICMSYLDSSHFSDPFRYIIYRIPIYGFVNMDYSILHGKKENKLKFILLLFEFTIIVIYSFLFT
jgi:hypothetical protein